MTKHQLNTKKMNQASQKGTVDERVEQPNGGMNETKNNMEEDTIVMIVIKDKSERRIQLTVNRMVLCLCKGAEAKCF